MPGTPVRKLAAVAVCAAAFAAVAVSRNAGPSDADPPAAPGGGPAFVLEPYLQFATRTSIVVMCETDAPTTCVVEYGPTFPPERTVEVQKPDTVHEVTLDGLRPNAKYFYRVVCTA